MNVGDTITTKTEPATRKEVVAVHADHLIVTWLWFKNLMREKVMLNNIGSHNSH